MAEIGDIGRFDDFDQLLAYAGVHPAERSSGTKGARPETSWHMSKADRRVGHPTGMYGVSLPSRDRPYMNGAGTSAYVPYSP